MNYTFKMKAGTPNFTTGSLFPIYKRIVLIDVLKKKKKERKRHPKLLNNNSIKIQTKLLKV